MPSQSTSISAIQTKAAPYCQNAPISDIQLVETYPTYIIEICPVTVNGDPLSAAIRSDRISGIFCSCVGLRSCSLQRSNWDSSSGGKVASWWTGSWVVVF